MGSEGLDAVAQAALLWGVLALLGLLLVGGFVRPIGGTWQDGAHRIVLRQFGFLVRGEGAVAGGKQVFRGVAAFGWVRLWRYDFGRLHLSELGFVEVQHRALFRQVMGHFRFQLIDTRLVGSFVGRHFRFSEAALVHVAWGEPRPRQWQRQSTES